MLGNFLEFGITSRDILGSLAFYERCGCVALPVGDIVPTPYAVIRADQMTIGLHDRELEGPALTFVRPNVARCATELRARGVEIEFAELTEDRFNRLAFVAPDGQRVLLLEAPTFAAATSADGTSENPLSICGRFVEWSMPSGALDEAVGFWTGLGFRPLAASQDPHPWVRLAGFGATIGLHARTGFRPGPRFECRSLDARLDFLRARQLEARRGSPFAPADRAAVLLGPEGCPLYLHEIAET